MIENRQVCDRAWPIPKTPSREERIDDLVCNAMYRDWDWLDSLTLSDCREIITDAVHACWRGDRKDFASDQERLLAIKYSLRGFIEPWAENKVEEE